MSLLSVNTFLIALTTYIVASRWPLQLNVLFYSCLQEHSFPYSTQTAYQARKSFSSKSLGLVWTHTHNLSPITTRFIELWAPWELPGVANQKPTHCWWSAHHSHLSLRFWELAFDRITSQSAWGFPVLSWEEILPKYHANSVSQLSCTGQQCILSRKISFPLKLLHAQHSSIS